MANFCPHCGAQLPRPGAAFCATCGRSLQARPTTAGVSPSAAPQLRIQLPGRAEETFVIARPRVTIGRDPASNLPIDETFPGWQTVSRQHALISRHERGYVIEDLGSQNGVRVNGRLTPKNLLRNGWQVSVGGVTFRFVDETETN